MFLDSNDNWNKSGMSVGEIDELYVECLTDHLSSFTMVILDAKVKKKLPIKIQNLLST